MDGKAGVVTEDAAQSDFFVFREFVIGNLPGLEFCIYIFVE
jgi:hypothetical protein